jgi:hypothetical protein
VATIESRGWIDRIIESIKGVIVGLILVVVCVVLLFWNEGRAVQTAQSLDEGSKVVRDVKPDSVDSANNGKLVHTTGDLSTKETLKDTTFGATANALILRRKVEMYQRKLKTETKKKNGGGEDTIYTCDEKVWSSEAEDVSKCNDVQKNPDMASKSEDFVASEATLGAFKVSAELLQQLTGGDTLAVTADTLKEADAETAKKATISDGKVYVGKDPGHPEIGDVRVSFSVVKPTTASVLAAQKDGGFAPYQSKAGDQLLTLTPGSQSAAEMFKSAKAANSTLTWILRFVGWLLMAIGFFLIFRPLETVADVLPIFGTLLGAGLFIFACLLASMVSTVTCAIAWIFYRPILAIALIGAGVACVVVLVVVGKSRKKG